MQLTFQADTSTLEAMRKQEQAYTCRDYLYQEDGCVRERLALPQTAINVSCRSSMVQWKQTVVGFIGFDPETVEISMSYLDRFLATENGREAINCRTVFQLASMTALYTAVKINCAEALTPKLLAELSQGVYEEEQFEEMERTMLQSIQWRVNPATSTCFLHETLDILPQSLFQTEEIRQSVLSMAKSQAEWAIGDYELLSVKKSVIAFAAIHNSLRSHRIRFNLHRYLQKMVQGQNMDLDTRQTTLIQKTLRAALPKMEDESASFESTKRDVVEEEEEEEECDHSVKSLGNNDEDVKGFSKSPRSVIYRNVAA